LIHLHIFNTSITNNETQDKNIAMTCRGNQGYKFSRVFLMQARSSLNWGCSFF